jgi:hypothetical protein
MKPVLALRAVALVALALGLIGIAGAVFLKDITPFLRSASMLVAALLVAAAWLLAHKRKTAVPLLWLSAAAYAAAIVLPALQRHGPSAFSVQMPAFYWSLGLRVLLAVLAEVAIRSLLVAQSEGESPAAGRPTSV